MMRSGGFSPASLFAGGTEGAWYDPSDLSTLFQDSAGTTPVTASGQLLGLRLDKSKGLVPGAEVVTNGGFDTNLNNWAAGSAGVSISMSGGGMKVQRDVDGAIPYAKQAITLVAGKRYTVRYTVLEISVAAGKFPRLIVSSGDAVGPAITVPGDYSLSFVATSTSRSIYLTSDLGGTSVDGDFAVWDNVSIRELPGNHATQATAGLTSRYQVSPFGSEYDGNDDFSAQPFKPTLAGTIAVRMRSDTASRVAFGSQPASNGRCYIGLASDGSLAGGIGEQATSVIKGSADIRGDLVTGILTWDGTTVSLYQDGVSVYSAAQLGAVNTTVAMHEGALNNNGTAAAFHKGRIAQSIVLDRVMTAAEIASLTNLWSTIS